jgi:hypothetical protein
LADRRDERGSGDVWGLCPEHQKLADDGFVALVECDPQRSGAPGADHIKPEQAYRTGRLAHLRRAAFARVFNMPIEDRQACVFVEPGVIKELQAMVVDGSRQLETCAARRTAFPKPRNGLAARGLGDAGVGPLGRKFSGLPE